MFAKTKVNQIIWMKCNVLPKMHGVAAQKKQTMSMHAFILLQTKLLYVLLICEPFILAGLQQTMELLYLMLFSLVMLLCAVVVCLAQSFLFGHINFFFLKNKIILSRFYVIKMSLFLNIDVSLCIQIKKNFNWRKKALGSYFLWDFRSRSTSRLHTIS